MPGDSDIRCSVTVMPVISSNGKYKIGFVRRHGNDSYLPGTLVAPGGKLEKRDGRPVHDVMYFSPEDCAVRELLEECNLKITKSQLRYFCGLTLPNGKVVLSFYCLFSKEPGKAKRLVYLTESETRKKKDFAPGMEFEALMLFRLIKSQNSSRK
ncbi:MAG: NUDIX domain-containing protein [Candidatus Micrarchaeota archaeon]|nr:NUDIX domain-containing protein [Candidatus Micrarchaeota archaeon]